MTQATFVFLDAGWTIYRYYYGSQISMENVILMEDNALVSLVSANDDPVRRSLHEFS